MRQIILISFFLLLSLPKDNIKLRLDVKPDLFEIDKLGNFYVYSNYELKKYSSEAKLLYIHNQLHLGKAYSIDVSDPMQIMLFYKDFNQVVFLDKQLNPLGEAIELDNLRLSSVGAVCKSKQSSIWIYDSFENELILYAFNKQTITNRYKLSVFEPSIQNISYMLESASNLYLNESNKCIWVFDKFSNNLQQLPIKTPHAFQVVDGNILFENIYYNVNPEEHKTFSNIDAIRNSNNTFYILSGKTIEITDSLSTKQQE